MNKTKFTFVDLGLPSGKLWATENVKDENGVERHFTFNEAVQAFGKNLPSKEDWKELFDNSTCSWNEERMGFDVVGPNGNSIFLLAAGYRIHNIVNYVGNRGYYWSSSVYHKDNAYRVLFSSRGLNPRNHNYCCRGFSVRLVQ